MLKHLTAGLLAASLVAASSAARADPPSTVPAVSYRLSFSVYDVGHTKTVYGKTSLITPETYNSIKSLKQGDSIGIILDDGSSHDAVVEGVKTTYSLQAEGLSDIGVSVTLDEKP